MYNYIFQGSKISMHSFSMQMKALWKHFKIVKLYSERMKLGDVTYKLGDQQSQFAQDWGGSQIADFQF